MLLRRGGINIVVGPESCPLHMAALTAFTTVIASVHPCRGFAIQLLYVLLHYTMVLITEPQCSTQLSEYESEWSGNRALVVPNSTSGTCLIEKKVMQCDFRYSWFWISRLEASEVKALPPTTFHGVAPHGISLAYGTAG